MTKLPEYKQHPVALALMPGGMDDTEFDAFCEDVAQRGIIYPITLHDGMVLDGWHRYRAAKRVGCGVREIHYEGNDPAGYIAACNVLRRKLSSLQRALVGARLHRDHGITQREACKKLGISNEVLTLVLKAIDSRNSKIIKRIESESDFSRSMLKDELEDSGLLRTKRVAVDVPLGANSVFDLAAKSFISETASTVVEPEEDIEEHEDEVNVYAKGKRPEHVERKPKPTAPQLLAYQFKALMAGEKAAFIELIWAEAKSLAPKGKK